MRTSAVRDSSQRRRRRSTEALRADLLSAAADVFAKRGYAGATTKEIAEVAATPQASIYRHYGSKAELFVAAVAQPFHEMIDEFSAAFTDRMQSDPDPFLISRALVSSLYEHLEDRQAAVFALIAASREPEAQQVIADAVSGLDEMFDTLHQFGIELWRDGPIPYRVERAETFQRLVTAMVVAATALQPLLFPHAGIDGESHEEFVTVMTELVTYGWLDNRPTSEASVRSAGERARAD